MDQLGIGALAAAYADSPGDEAALGALVEAVMAVNDAAGLAAAAADLERCRPLAAGDAAELLGCLAADVAARHHHLAADGAAGRAELEAAVAAVLVAGPCRPDDVAAALEVPASEVVAALSALIDAGQVACVPAAAGDAGLRFALVDPPAVAVSS